MRIIRYFFVGAAAAAVDIGVFVILAKAFGLPWFPVALFSFILATLVNYQLSIRHVFSSGVRFAQHHELALVFLVSAAGLVVNQTVLWLLIEKLSWDLVVSKVGATGLVFFWNYTVRRYFIFSNVG
jgi:putative flippase GtrA